MAGCHRLTRPRYWKATSRRCCSIARYGARAIPPICAGWTRRHLPRLTKRANRWLALGAIDEGGHITPHGRKLAALPLPPNLAHMVVVAAASGQGEQAATLALLLQERGLGRAG